MSFENWKRRLAGEKITAYLQPQLEDEGYYRKPIVEAVLGVGVTQSHAPGGTSSARQIVLCSARALCTTRSGFPSAPSS